MISPIKDALYAALTEYAHADLTLLVKGSRCMGLERVADRLAAEYMGTQTP